MLERLDWLPPFPVDLPHYYELGAYDVDRVNGRIAAKYINRSLNLRRSWVRICTHFPETTVPGQNMKILELSTAHGAMLELWRSLGHDVEGADFAVPVEELRPYHAMRPHLHSVFENTSNQPVGDEVPGWIYQPIIESLGLKVTLFDGRVTPYVWDSKSFDIVCCYQAIEAFAPCEDWDRVIDEMCRIARKSVVIGFNPPGLSGENSDWDAMRHAWEKLRTYDRNGFHNVMFEIDKSRRGLHPTTVKLMAK